MNKKIILGKKKVASIRHLLVEDAATIIESAPIEALLHKIIEDPRTRHVYVLNEAKKLVGSVRMSTIVNFLFPVASVVSQVHANTQGDFLSFGAKKVSALMNKKPFYVAENDTLSQMAMILMREKINELPVVDTEMHVIGQVNMYEVINSFLQSDTDITEKQK